MFMLSTPELLRIRTIVLVNALIALLSTPAHPQAVSLADRAFGDWVGALVTPAGKLRMLLPITRDSGGDSFLLLQNALISAAAGVQPAVVQRGNTVNRPPWR